MRTLRPGASGTVRVSSNDGSPSCGLVFQAATSIGEYDAVRALADEKLEEVRAIPYSRPGGAADSAVERYTPPGPPDATEGDLTISVKTAFVDRHLSGPADSPPTGQMRVGVLVTWDAGSYSTVGIVSGEPP